MCVDCGANTGQELIVFLVFHQLSFYLYIIMDSALPPAPSLTPSSSSADMSETPLRPRDTRQSPPQTPPHSSPSPGTPVQPPPLREPSSPKLLLSDPHGCDKVAHSSLPSLRPRPGRRSSSLLTTTLLEPDAATARPSPGGLRAPQRGGLLPFVLSRPARVDGAAARPSLAAPTRTSRGLSCRNRPPLTASTQCIHDGPWPPAKGRRCGGRPAPPPTTSPDSGVVACHCRAPRPPLLVARLQQHGVDAKMVDQAAQRM